MDQNLNIVFIGGGNMGQALVGGLLQAGWLATAISIIDTDQSLCSKLEKQFPDCHIFSQTEAAINLADIVVLAVKPQAMQVACENIAEPCQSKRPLLISIAAGVQIQDIDHWLGGELPIIRCMPNTPALVQAAMTGLYANQEVNDAQHELAENILSSIGLTLWLEKESMLDAVTAISGSGPAYFYYLIETMQQSAESLGLSQKQAKLLSIQTAVGAAKLLQDSNKDAKELRFSVTSKGGTTEAAINVLENANVKQIIETAIHEAAQKSQQLAQTHSLLKTDKNI